MLDVQFPVKYFEGNKVFAHDNESWAFFELEGYFYDFVSPEQKLRRSRKLKDFLASIGYDTHLLVTSHFISIDEIQEKAKKELTGELKKVAVNHYDESAIEIKKILGDEATDYRYFIGVQLPKFDFESNDLKALIEQVKDFKNRFFNFFDLEDLDITRTEYERAQTKSEGLLKIFRGFFPDIKPVTEEDIAWLIKRNFFRSITNSPVHKHFKLNAEKKEKGINVNAPDLLRLTEGTINHARPGELSITQRVEGEEKTGYTAFLTVSNMPTEDFHEVGNEWIYISQDFDFPVDTSIRTKTRKRQEMQDVVRKTKKEIQSEKDNAAQVDAEVPDEVLESERIIRQLETDIKGSKSVTFETSIVFAVSASTREELNARVKTVVNRYSEMDVELSQPGSDQWLLFNEFLPAGKKYVKDYNRIISPGRLASGMFGATTKIGDNRGFFFGIDLANGNPVYIDPSMAAKNLTKTATYSLSASFIGPPGGGKSFGANVMTYQSVLQGGLALIVDPKNDRTYWEETLEYLEGHVNVITLTGEKENQGKLDPFLVCSSMDRAKTLAVNICTFLLQAPFYEDAFTYISDAAEEVTKMNRPCMMKLVDCLLNHEDTDAQKTGKRLRTFANLSFARLLFGDGSPVKELDPKHKINVLQIANLSLPDAKKSVKNYDINEMLSMAMMFPIGEFAWEFMHNLPREIFKIIFFDESWFMEKTAIGKEIINKIQREGRSRNTGVYRATQAIDDTDDDSKSFVAMKFIFQNNDTEQCKKSLKFLGIDHEDSDNIEIIQNLDVGECLFKDIKGRVAKIKIMHLFKDLEDAFDTRPPSAIKEENDQKEKENTQEEEEEKEKERIYA